MVRRITIAFLTFAAVVVLGVSCACYFLRVEWWVYGPKGLDPPVLEVFFWDGDLGLAYYSPDPRAVTTGYEWSGYVVDYMRGTAANGTKKGWVYGRYDHIYVRAWAFFPLAGLLGYYPVLALLWRPWQSYRRRRRGECIRCGYNLAGNASGVCPECGTAIRTVGQDKADD